MGHRLSKEQRMQQEQNSKPNELNSSTIEKSIKEHKLLLLENNQNHFKISENFPSHNLSLSSTSASAAPSSIATATAAAATSVIIIIRMLKMESNDCNKELLSPITTNCITEQNKCSSSTNDVCCANTTDIDKINNITDQLENELTITYNQNVQKDNCRLNDLLNNDNLNNTNENNIITHINNNEHQINNHNNNISSNLNDSLNLHSKNSKFCDTKNHIFNNNNNNNNNNPNENKKMNNKNFSDSDIKELNVNLISETNYKKTIKEQHQHHPVVFLEPVPMEQIQQRSMATDDSCGTSMQQLHSPQQQQSTSTYLTMEPIVKTKVKKSNNWKLNCAKSKNSKGASSSAEFLQNNIVTDESLASSSSNCDSFMNTSHNTIPCINTKSAATIILSSASDNKTQSQNQLIDFSRFNMDHFPIEDCDKTARLQRALEIAEGVEPPPGFQPSKLSETLATLSTTTTASTPPKRDVMALNSSISGVNCISGTAITAGPAFSLNSDMINTIQSNDADTLVASGTKTNSATDAKNNEQISNNRINVNPACNWLLTTSNSAIRLMLPPVVQEISLFESIEPPKLIIHSQVDYIHCLVPDLKLITNCSFYWGKMDRYEAERLLEGKPEGTFLLRDSAQEEFLFSVSFRKYGRSLHARIEQFNHKFSFDCHDPGVYTSPTVTGLLEHYKDPACVMFFEPALTLPLNRNFCFSLQQLCRATIVSHTSYDGVANLTLPKMLKSYLKEYHYRQRVRIKRYDDPIYNNS